MKQIVWYFLMIIGFWSCSSSNEPLSNADLNLIEDKIIAAISAGKLEVFTDMALTQQEEVQNFLNLVPEDSTGRKDFSRLSFVTQELLAVAQGNFGDNNTEIGAILLNTEIPVSNGSVSVEAGFVKWTSLKPVLNKIERDGLSKLSDNFVSQNKTIYEQEVDFLKLKKITEKLYKAAINGEVAAYENENMASFYNPNELQRLGAREEVLSIPDGVEGLLKDTIVIDPITADDIIDYKPHFDENMQLVAYSFIYLFKEGGYQIKVPWVVVSHEDAKKVLEEEQVNFLSKYFERASDEDGQVEDNL